MAERGVGPTRPQNAANTDMTTGPWTGQSTDWDWSGHQGTAWEMSRSPSIFAPA